MRGRLSDCVGLSALAMAALLSVPGWAGTATPDGPAELYYFLNVGGRGPDVGEMDSRLGEMAAAFGRGEFARCRELAGALQHTAEPEQLRAEATAYVVEAFLAQGEFEKALRSAEEHDDPDMAARVASRQSGYAAAISRLKLPVGLTQQRWLPQTLSLARVHRQAGCLELAQSCYWSVVTGYPNCPEAAQAASEVVYMHQAYGTPEGVQAVCKILIEFDPDSTAAVAACRAVSGSQAAWQRGQPASTMDMLREIVERHPGTRSGAVSGMRLGELLVDSGRHEQADKVWSQVLHENAYSAVSEGVRCRLAELRYQCGMKAFAEGSWESAAGWLGALLPDVGLLDVRRLTGQALPDSHSVVQSKRRHAIFSLGEAHQNLGHWREAADAFARLVIAGNPAEEIALSKLVVCYRNMGNLEEARRARALLIERFPDSGFLEHLDDIR